MAADQLAADPGFGAAAEENAVGQDNRRLPGRLGRLDRVQEKGVVAVPGGRDPQLEAVELVLGR
jgi:hypothetical protein